MKVTARMTAIARTPATEKTSATANYECKCEEKRRAARRRCIIVNSRVQLHSRSTATAKAMVSATGRQQLLQQRLQLQGHFQKQRLEQLLLVTDEHRHQGQCRRYRHSGIQHPQSSTGAFRCRTGSPYSATGLVLASAASFSFLLRPRIRPL